MGIELLRVGLGSDDGDWLIAQVRDALAQADALDHLAVLHLATPDRRASDLRTRVFAGGYGVHYPAGTPERVARQLLNEFQSALRLRSPVERDFDFFVALTDTLAELDERRRPGRPLVDELLTAWKRLAQAVAPDDRTADLLKHWRATLGERFAVFAGVVERYRARLAETESHDPEDVLWLAAAGIPHWSLRPALVIVDDLDRVSPARAAFLTALGGSANRVLYLVRGESATLDYLRQAHDAQQRLVLEAGGRVIPAPELPGAARAGLIDAWLQDSRATGDVELIRPHTRAAEVRQAAQFARREINRGTPPSALCIAMPATASYAELLAETFTASGIPFDSPFETPLVQTAPVAAVLDLLRAAHDGLERAALLDALASPYMAFGGDRDETRLRRLHEATRAGWVVGGRDLRRDWIERLEPCLKASVLRWLTRVLTLVEPFTRGTGAAADLVEAAAEVMRESLAATVADADAATGDAEAAVRALALHEFGRLLDEMAAEFRRTGNPSLRVSELLRAISEQAETRAVRAPRPSGERVRVLGLRELRGARFEHVMILGLTDVDLPLSEEDSMFFPAAREEALARETGAARASELCRPIDAARQADYLFAHALRSAASRLVLSMPRAAGDTPFVPSVPFARLLRCLGAEADALPIALGPDSPTSVHELSRMVARQLARVELGAEASHALPLSPELRAGLRARVIELSRTDLTGAPGEFDGMVGALPGLAQRFSADAGDDRQVYSPSQLDNYAECPMRFWARYIVGAKVVDEPTLDTPPHAVGILIHRAFERYVLLLRREAGQPDVLEDPLRRAPVHLLQIAADEQDARRLGFQLIRQAFEHACEVENTEGPFWEGIKQQARAGLPGEPDVGLGRGLLARFIDEEITRAHQGIGARFVEFDFGKDNRPTPDAPDAVPAPIDLPLEHGFIRLMGSVDRVDEGPDGLEIVDYKTGGARTTTEVRDGMAFQLATYLAAIARLADSQPRGMSYLLVPARKPLKREEVWLTRGKPAFDVARLVTQVLPRRLARVMQALSQGVFQHLPFASPGGPCRYCDYAGACARRDDVIAERQASAAETGAYMPDQEAQS